MRLPTRALLLLLPLLALSACSDDAEGGGPNPNEVSVEVKEIKPTGGPIAGGTVINVYGSGFKEGAKLFLGEHEATQVVVVSAIRITAKTPPAAAARVDVKVVNPDGKQAVLTAGFLYEGAQQPTIVQAEVYNETREVVSTGAPVSELIRGAVQVPGVTRGEGQGAGVLAQVGYAPGGADVLDPASYTWSDAVYDDDSESGEADIYKGTVPLQGPTGEDNREWAVTLRFSVDGGVTWVMADRDGVANGLTANQIPRVFVGKPSVEWCKLGNDGDNSSPQVHYTPGQTELAKIKGYVYATGITNNAGQGPGITGEIGWGPADEDPRTSTNWHWSAAEYKGDVWSNDEYEATLPHPGPEGTYKFAFRFSLNNGRTRYCDADGHNDSNEGDLAFNLGKLGTLTVSPEAPKPAVAWCKLGDNDVNDPETVNYAVEQEGDRTILAQVYMKDVTDKVGAGVGLSGQLGWGPVNEDPRTSAQWNWDTPLAFNRDRFDNNDEWKATLPNPGAVGTYKFAVRFSVNGGPVRVCDSDGHNDEGLDFDVEKLGILNVQGDAPPPPTVVGYCKLGPDGNNSVETVEYMLGQPASRTVLGSAYVEGATPGTGQGAGVTAELGWGPQDEDPRTSSGWTWAAATYKGDIGNNDEYEATLPHPEALGSYRFAYRFKANDGEYLYCDSDGATDASGFDVAQLGVLNVVDAAAVTVDWCKLGGEAMEAPPSELYRVGQPADRVIYAQVYKTGITVGEGAGAGLHGELGWGPEDEDPSTGGTSWSWTAATFNRDSGNNSNDEFQATLPNPGTVGQYKFAYRFRIGDSGAYRYCDADGLDNDGFTLEQAGTLTVSPPEDSATAWCVLRSVSAPSVMSGGAVTVVGRVHVPGVTDGDGAGAGLRVQVGLGDEGVDASATPGDFSWMDATYALDPASEVNTDEYSAELSPAYTADGTGDCSTNEQGQQCARARAISFRYSQDDGATWTYCDSDGSNVDGYTAERQPALTVTKHTDIDYCKLQWPSRTSDQGGDRTVYGRLYEDGITTPDVEDPNVVAELGYGDKSQDPGVSGWTWVASAANNVSGGDDEYMARVPMDAAEGTSYLWRFRIGTGPWCYGDVQPDGVAGGSANGVNSETLGLVDSPSLAP